MRKKQEHDDPEHYDGVYIGRPVPPSVFYRSGKRNACFRFKMPVDIRVSKERERELKSRKPR